MLNKQDVLNIAAKHYAEGGLPGYAITCVGPQCAYFAPDGGRCAMGVLFEHLGITYEHLGNHDAESIDRILKENKEVHDRLHAELEPSLFDIDQPDYRMVGKQHFLARLQKAHDEEADRMADFADGDEVTEWPDDAPARILSALRDFADYEGLEFNF